MHAKGGFHVIMASQWDVTKRLSCVHGVRML